MLNQINPGIKKSQGFTLIELIIVILLIGILSGVLKTILTGPMQQWVQIQYRASLVDIAETALQRMTREIRFALPNSIRLADGGGGNLASCDIATAVGNICSLEFLRTLEGSRYRRQLSSLGVGTVLDFTVSQQDATTTARFDVLEDINIAGIDTGNTSVPCLASTTADCLVIYNTGQPLTNAQAVIDGVSANAYLGVGAFEFNIATISEVTVNSIGFDNSDVVGASFGFPSRGQRFYIVDTPVSFICSANQIRRYDDYAITAAQAVPPVAPPLTLNDNLLINQLQSCQFDYNAGSSSRAGLITIRLTIQSADPTVNQSVTLMQQTHISNQP